MENSENNQGSDKTRIQFSSDSNNKNSSKEDSTRIENNVNSQSQSDNTKKSEKENNNVNDTDNNSENINKREEDLKSKADDKNKISKGTAVAAGVLAGVVGATAGVAAGVHFNDEIKNAITQSEYNAPESISQEEQNNNQNQTAVTANTTASIGTTENATPDHSTNDFNGAHLISNATTTDNIETANASNSSTLNLEYHDNTGTYEINCIDVNSDGKIDSMTMNAEMVDGTSLSYTATGETLNQLLMGDVHSASPNDYISFNPNSQIIDLNCQIPDVTGFPETSSYTIQPGDTLSEIAAQNNTTVEELMAHNPQIDDPNLIYAGHQLNIPGQNAEIITPESNEVISEVLPEYDTNIDHNTFDAIETNETADYAQTDWQSFEDTPVDMSNIDDNYLNAMNDTDFDNFGSSDNYYDSSTENTGIEFV